MAERLHYFTEASTTVSFDCSDSDIESDVDSARRPNTDTDRAKQHARQLQLWSDEARRRRSPAQAPLTSPHRRPSSDLPPSLATLPGPAKTELRDRQQSNLSERNRVPNSRVSRSQSAKNLRIRITPSSSSKSLLSDIESEQGQSISAPQSPRAGERVEKALPTITIGEGHEVKSLGKELEKAQMMKEAVESVVAPSPVEEKVEEESSERMNLTRRLSQAVRRRRLPMLRNFFSRKKS